VNLDGRVGVRGGLHCVNVVDPVGNVIRTTHCQNYGVCKTKGGWRAVGGKRKGEVSSKSKIWMIFVV
jgi:hypothetical protein